MEDCPSRVGLLSCRCPGRPNSRGLRTSDNFADSSAAALQIVHATFYLRRLWGRRMTLMSMRTYEPDNCEATDASPPDMAYGKSDDSR